MLRKREPTSPGEILLEEFLKPLGLTQRRLADHLGCDVKVINRIVNGRTGVTPEMALKLGAAFQTSPEFWLNAQKAVDLYRAAEHSGSCRTLSSGRADRTRDGMENPNEQLTLLSMSLINCARSRWPSSTSTLSPSIGISKSRRSSCRRQYNPHRRRRRTNACRGQ